MPEPVATAFLADPNAELEVWGPLDEATGPQMDTAGLSFWEDGKGADSGIWECTPGPSHWTLETNEFIYVVSGRMTVTPDGGEPLDLGPGNSAVFPVGWTGTWQIHETLRKLYVIY
jgi:uncharacterized cupin superfamily protein